MTKVAGVWSGHDASYCVLQDGVPVIHDEYERFNREKEPPGDAVKLLLDNYKDYEDIDYLVTTFPTKKLFQYKDSYAKISDIVSDNGGKCLFLGHHQAHAANAYFSSNFKESLIITMDGGGVEDANNTTTAFTIWQGKDNKIKELETFPIFDVNIGGVWTRATRYIFNLQSGWPTGHQAGTVMAMAALGDPDKYFADFKYMFKSRLREASFKPLKQPSGANTGKDPIHPYLNKWRIIAESDEVERFNLAAGLQKATEHYMKELLSYAISLYDSKNICFAGGVALNSVAIGKVKSWFPSFENVYVTPTPHDGGLSLGAAQFVYHHSLDNPKITWKTNFTPYLGRTYTEVEVLDSIKSFDNLVTTELVNDDKVVDLLDQQKIVSVFGKGSESGKRALGNRSILSDPRSEKMKELINEKVKHRQWFRPFAPSILKSEVKKWFTKDLDSPYMSFVSKFKAKKLPLVPAVAHFDGTARLQTVTPQDNFWYFNFLTKWFKKSEVPILLNTSFNDREPICETPSHALNCFLKTDIDYLYFRDYFILVSKK